MENTRPRACNQSIPLLIFFIKITRERYPSSPQLLHILIAQDESIFVHRKRGGS